MRLILLLFIFATSISVYAKDLGTLGSLYKIEEQDILEVMKDRASKVDWQALVDKEKASLKERIGKINLVIDKAPKTVTRYIDLTTSLKEPVYIRDRTGKPKELYPKGYRFNVLDYTTINQRFVFFDATRKEELEWYKKNYKDNLTYMPIISRGAALKLAEDIGREVYLIDDEHIKTFQIKRLPVVVYQEGNKLRADEFYLKVVDNESK